MKRNNLDNLSTYKETRGGAVKLLHHVKEEMNRWKTEEDMIVDGIKQQEEEEEEEGDATH